MLWNTKVLWDTLRGVVHVNWVVMGMKNTHPLPNGHLSMVTSGRVTTFGIKKNKNKKPNVRLNILDEGYPLDDESNTHIYIRL